MLVLSGSSHRITTGHMDLHHHISHQRSMSDNRSHKHNTWCSSPEHLHKCFSRLPIPGWHAHKDSLTLLIECSEGVVQSCPPMREHIYPESCSVKKEVKKSHQKWPKVRKSLNCLTFCWLFVDFWPFLMTIVDFLFYREWFLLLCSTVHTLVHTTKKKD